MTEIVNTYWAKFGIDASEFVGGINQAQSSFLAFYRDVTLSATMTLELFGKLIDQVKKFGDAANAILDLSYQTGVATDKLQQMQYAALLAGQDAGSLSNSLNILTRSIESATDATSAQAKAFATLNVSTDGRTVDQVFDDTAKALDGMSDVTKRNTLAMDIFGRSYKDILPLMETYVKKADEIRAHPVYTEKELIDLNKGKVAWESLTDSATTYFGKVVAFAQSDEVQRVARILSFDFTALGGILAPKTGGITGGADWTALEANADILKDKYAGLTDEQIDLMDATDALTQAQKDQAAALKKGSQEDYAIASRAVALYTNRVATCKAALEELNATAATTARSMKTAWGNDVIVGTPGSEMYDYLMAEMEAGTDYQTALQKWSQGAQHFQAGSLGQAKDTGAAGTAKANKVSEENKKIQDAYQAGYVALEKLTLTHETAESEMARIKYQSILDVAGQTKNWLGSNPLIQKQAVLSKNGYDIDISPLPNVTVPRLSSADFGSVKLTGGNEGNSSGGNTTNTTNNVYVTTKDNPQAVAKGVSQALANQNALGGAT
jgi:hypothetical protein